MPLKEELCTEYKQGFDLSRFERDFYYMLGKQNLDTFNGKICYNCHILRVKMTQCLISEIIDISGMSEKVLYSRSEK